MPEGTTTYVTIAYTLTWVVLLGYRVRLGIVRRRAESALRNGEQLQ